MDLSSSADDGKWLRATLDLDRASGRPATALAALSKIAAPDGGAPKAELLQLRCELLREMGAGRAPPPPARAPVCLGPAAPHVGRARPGSLPTWPWPPPCACARLCNSVPAQTWRTRRRSSSPSASPRVSRASNLF